MAVCFVVAAGCEFGPPTKPDLAPVTGVVLYRGAPVESAMVEFIQERAPFRSMGLTDHDGRFRLTSVRPGDGAPIGKNSVVVSARRVFLDPRASGAADSPIGPATVNADPANLEPDLWVVDERLGSGETVLVDPWAPGRTLRDGPLNTDEAIEHDFADSEVEASSDAGDQQPPATATAETELPSLPAKYAVVDTSDLEFEVVEGQVNHFEIILSD
jgi:hypothetical protein